MLSTEYNIYAKCFYSALLKFVDILGRKGCNRSALEFNKFLIKINPYEDPVGNNKLWYPQIYLF